MLIPKLVGPSDKKSRSWYECPYCYDLFEADPYQIRVRNTVSCGCRKQKAAERGLNTEEKMRVAWLLRERTRAASLPGLLGKLVQPKRTCYRWNPELNLLANQNFIEDTSPRPDNCQPGWKDFTADFDIDNFVWIPIDDTDERGTDRDPD